ncbi:MAG: 2'-5' RNA ligase family protein, partial [Nitrospiraceae bacterium]
HYGADTRDIDQIVQIMHDYGRPIRVSMGALNVFENPEMDVLYVELIGDSLVSLHNKIAKLPFARPSNRPQYIPHLTLAYLKKGAGRKFIGQSPFKRIISASGLTIIDSAGIEKIIRTQPDEVNQREPILLAGM